MYKIFLIIFICLFLVTVPTVVFAQETNNTNAFAGGFEKIKTVAGAEGAGIDKIGTIEDVIKQVVGIISTFIGVLFFVLMIYGGYIWMMARGNDQDVDKAKNIIRAAIIGLIVVLGAYAITAFVLGALA